MDIKNFKIVNKELLCYLGTDKDVIIPTGITTISEGAFKNADIESVIIPDTVLNIGSYAFAYCSNLVRVCMSDNIEHIGSYAFMYCVKLKDICIPKSLTTIEEGVFLGCRELNIEIPEGILNIGKLAFEGTGLVNVILPKMLINVGMQAFASCDIENVHVLGKTVFEGLAFSNCKKFKEFIVSDNNESFITINGDLYTKDGKALVCVANGKRVLEIPYGVEVIKQWACANSCLEKVEFSKTVSLINDYAFSGCDNLMRVSILGNIKTIRRRAFWSKSLTEVEICEGVEVVEQDAIYGSFTKLVLPSSIKFIGAYAFTSTANASLCVDISKINVNAYIDSCAFINCKSGYSEWVYSRSDLAFKESSGNVAYVDSDKSDWFIAFFPPSILTNRNHIKYAMLNFVECIKRSLSLSKSHRKDWAEYIAKYYKEWIDVAITNPFLMLYFVDKKLLTKDEAKELLKSNIDNEEVRQLLLDYIKIKGYKLFKKSNKNLTNIPEDITAVGCCAFNQNNEIEKVIIPNKVVSIGSYGFEGAKKLKEVVLNSELKYIGEHAFVACESLEKLEFSGTIEQWDSIYKGDGWNLFIPAKKVTCLDGEVFF